MAVREHFLEQMRTYMIGGAAVMSPPGSPHRVGHHQQHSIDSSSSSIDDNRDRLRHLHMQQQGLPTQQQQQQVGAAICSCYIVGTKEVVV